MEYNQAYGSVQEDTSATAENTNNFGELEPPDSFYADINDVTIVQENASDQKSIKQPSKRLPLQKTVLCYIATAFVTTVGVLALVVSLSLLLRNSNQENESLRILLNQNQTKTTIELQEDPQQLTDDSSQDIESLRILLNLTKTTFELQEEDLNRELERLRHTLQEQQKSFQEVLKTFPISCKDIPQNFPTGEHWISAPNNSPVKVYCDMNPRNCSCNTTGGWMRAAHLDMTDPNQGCPDGIVLVTPDTGPPRTCGRTYDETRDDECVSVTYPSYGVEYSYVCGRMVAYQQGEPNAFKSYYSDPSRTIDRKYTDGVSLTYGQSPRKHIWTFANALSDDPRINGLNVCPCTHPELEYTGSVPPFIGQDYFCDTGIRGRGDYPFSPDDPLWDGQGCGGTSTCCEFNNPPWFCKQLPQATTDDIELRLCGSLTGKNLKYPLLEIVDIYIK